MSKMMMSCRGCGYLAPTRWKGPCPSCKGLWSISPKRVSDDDGTGGAEALPEDGELVSLSHIREDVPDVPRIVIGGKFPEIDEMLGGGLVPSTVTLFAGDAGVGKSTLILQILQRLTQTKHNVIYFSGEESVIQVARRSKRLGRFNPRLRVTRITDFDEILGMAEEHEPHVAVIDSVQTLSVVSPTSGNELEIGSAAAVTVSMRALHAFAETHPTCWIIVGHVTGQGDIAGPNSGLIHAVDCVVRFKGDPRGPEYPEREMYVEGKNRFGAVGALSRVKLLMKEKGLSVDRRDRVAS